MTVNYTTNLALGQPVTGTESGTWGDDVNNSVTSYLDIAIAGGLSVTVTVADVTLVLTQGTSSATNIGSTTAQYAILNVSGAMTAARNLILPSSSRVYVINNNTTGGFALTVKGSATSGVTMVNGESAHIYWNGSDYAKAANTAGVATFTSLTLSGGTANGVAYLDGSKVLTTGSALTFDGSRVALSTATSNIQLTTTVNTNQAFISLADADGRTAVFRGPNSGTPNCAQIGTTTNHDTAFLYGNSEQMRLTSTGLGIGTSSPAAKLDVKGGTTISTLAGWNTLSNSMFELANPAVRFGIGYDSSDQVLLQGFDSSNAARNIGMQVYGGNVGIGTSSPSFKLDVTGVIRASSTIRTTGSDGVASANTAVIDYVAGSTSRFISYGPNTTTPGAIQFVGLSSNAGAGDVRATIDSAGNLGLGVTPSAWSLGKAIEVNNAGNALWGVAVSEIDVSQNAYYNAGWKYASSSYASRYEQNTGVHIWYNAPSGTAGNAITFTQAMTLDASGNLLVGQTSAGAVNSNSWSFTQSAAGQLVGNHASGSASGSIYIGFYYNTTNIGSITQSGTTAVLYNLTSDQRLKENIQDAESSSSLIDAIQVRQFNWKSDGSHTRYGFVAQELVTVAPEAVHQPTDPEEMMAVDYSKLVPMLVKEIQSLRKRLADAGIA